MQPVCVGQEDTHFKLTLKFLKIASSDLKVTILKSFIPKAT